MTSVQGQSEICEAVSGMSEVTIGLAAKGAVIAADCEQALLPLAHFAVNRWCDVDGPAIVSDALWLRKAVRLLALFMRGAVRFHDYEIEQARIWIASTHRADALVYASRSTSR